MVVRCITLPLLGDSCADKEYSVPPVPMMPHRAEINLHENIRPEKDGTTGRIDAILARIMALVRCVALNHFKRIHETHGLSRLEGPEPY